MRRGFFTAVISIVAACIAGALPSAASEGPQNDASSASRSFELANGARADRGLARYRWAEDLARVARAHSDDMASDGELRHNSRLDSQVSGWSALAENVGRGADADAIHNAFMDSSSHRRNIVGGYVELGVGAVVHDGEVWITQVFRTPARTVEKKARTSNRRQVEQVAQNVRPRSRYTAAAPARIRSVSRTADRTPTMPTGWADGTLAMLDRIAHEDVFVGNPVAVFRACARDARLC